MVFIDDCDRRRISLKQKPLFEEKNHCLPDANVCTELETRLIQTVEDAVRSKVLTPIIAENVKMVIKNFKTNQILGRKEIKNELGYGDYKAGKTIEAMQLLDIIIPIEGKGKGKYILKT